MKYVIFKDNQNRWVHTADQIDEFEAEWGGLDGKTVGEDMADAFWDLKPVYNQDANPELVDTIDKLIERGHRVIDWVI